MFSVVLTHKFTELEEKEMNEEITTSKRVVEARLREEVMIGEQQHGFMPTKFSRLQVCCGNTGGEVKRRSGRAGSCPRGCRGR